MTLQELESVLKEIASTRIAVIGDFCLDVYWMSDMSRSEVSIETGLETRPVREQRYSLGGAGNVVNNIIALGCKNVHAIGLVGADPWGKEMVRLLSCAGADVSGMKVQKHQWDTLAYIKPHINDVEQPRMDFGNFNQIDADSEDALIAHLDHTMKNVDVVVINEQVKQGIHSEGFRIQLKALIARHSNRIFIADSRHFSDSYPGAYLKLNIHEAVRLAGINRGPDELVMRTEALQAAEALYQRFAKPVFITRGERGCLVRDESGISEIPGIQVLGKVDTVGAGDSLLAGVACALAAGRPNDQAAELGNFAATVTIQKLRQTGTASPAEVLAVGKEPDYVYHPELAEDPRQAKYLDGCEIEVIIPPPSPFNITHAIFDHDGTISTLRQGWEAIMEPMMARAILGDYFNEADESLYHRVIERVRDYIDKSTGIQTLVQMQGLVRLVREFGLVQEEDILDEHGYKEIYNDDLMKLVRARINKLHRGELSVLDLTIKNAPEFLEHLKSAGIKLYLASGTDEQDVKDEAEALGYAHLFEGRIFGSVGDVTRDAKKVVLERILSDVGQSASGGLVALGDGPVEIRETRIKGGYTIGLASDEVRRYGLDASKRARLIRAGAHAIIPDFSQMDDILRFCGVGVRV